MSIGKGGRLEVDGTENEHQDTEKYRILPLSPCLEKFLRGNKVMVVILIET